MCVCVCDVDFFPKRKKKEELEQSLIQHVTKLYMGNIFLSFLKLTLI